jgi:hypothetical protein
MKRNHKWAVRPSGSETSEPGSDNVGFVVDKAAPRQVYSEYFGFPCQAFHQLLHSHHYPSSSGDGKMTSVIVD